MRPGFVFGSSTIERASGADLPKSEAALLDSETMQDIFTQTATRSKAPHDDVVLHCTHFVEVRPPVDVSLDAADVELEDRCEKLAWFGFSMSSIIGAQLRRLRV